MLNRVVGCMVGIQGIELLHDENTCKLLDPPTQNELPLVSLSTTRGFIASICLFL